MWTKRVSLTIKINSDAELSVIISLNNVDKKYQKNSVM